MGPVQQSEALLLFALVKTVVPRTLVEFGFFDGHSAFNFLQAMAADARLFSFDISAETAQIAEADFPKDPRFLFIRKSQTEFCPADIENRMIDFVFIDASHDLQLNQQTFERIYPALSSDAIICIHDTGLWHKDCFEPLHEEIAKQNRSGWVDDCTYAPHNDERRFVNWIADVYPAFQCVHFHSTRVLRHGLSILQRAKKLEIA